MEYEAYANDLFIDKTQANLALYELILRTGDKKNALINKLISLYLERCNFWHAFAFFQYRRSVDLINLTQLEVIFKER